MKLNPWLLSIVIGFTCLQTYTNVIVTTNSDIPVVGEITLREAITMINSGSGGGGEIIAFAPNVSTIQLLTPLPTITEQVTIDGLANVVGSAIQPGNCDTVPSPIDNLNLFIASLPITIDGSQIPSSNTTGQVGLFFLSASDDSVVRGIRIQNIYGTPDSPSASGIAAKEIDLNITVECCMIDRVLSLNNPLIPTLAIGLDNILTVSKTYVRNIRSAPINFALTSNLTQTGGTFGITGALDVTDTRVECVESGSILGKLDTSLDEPILSIGSAVGIANSETFNRSQNKSKGCFFGSNGTEEEMTVQNCLVSYIKGGSILLTVPANVTLNLVSGIHLETNLETLVEDCLVCDIQIGSATLSNDNNVGSEIDTQLITNNLFGIFIFNSSSNACIRNNTVKAISHGPIKIDVDNSITSIDPTVGISAQAIPLVIENNSVSLIFGGCHTISGTCSRIGLIQQIGVPFLGTTGIFAFQPFPTKHVTKTGSACPTPISNSDTLVVLCSNQVNTVSGGTRIAAGEGSSVVDIGSTGIFSAGSGKIVTNNNTVANISGTNFITKAPASNSTLLFGTKSIFSSSDEAELCNNTVSSVQEGTVHATLNSVHFNAEGSISAKTSSSIITFNFDSPANTTGIFATPFSASPFARIAIQDNRIEKVTGSQPTGSGIAPASVGIGISTSLPEENFKKIIQCGSDLLESTIFNNSVSEITSHITRPAYGIFSNQLGNTQSLTIENNTINTICGGDAALFQTMTGDINNLLSLLFCLEGTEIFNELIIIPSELPYEPTSGIYLLESDCTTIHNNTIHTVGKIDDQARGITTTASNDVEIYENSISQIKGPGIFIGGAPVPVAIGSDDNPILNFISASVRNVIYSNKTFDNSGKGIELGVSDWSNLFELVHLLSGSEGIPTITVIGNHNQPAPKLLRIVCNSSGTITIEARLNDANHPNSDFIIQFFVNSTNNIPHGETPISEFDGSEFILTTNGNGTAQKTFTFMPLAEINNGDNITAHVTLLTDGAGGSSAGSEISLDIGDTSEFGIEIKDTPGYSSLNRPKPNSFCFNKILSRP